ncbi:MAG: TonB-dependent receptor [Bacteroidetes bacterium]|nr:MAG: TonB-dependent receptor [Bacteroidota bacterium]
MTNRYILILASILISISALSQNLTQTVRGTIIDLDSKLPMIGVYVQLLDSDPKIGTISDENGNFRMERIPTGRISLQFSYSSYENKTMSNIVVNSGKEVVLHVTMQESTASIGGVVVRASSKKKGKASNDMSILSARSISPDETSRYAGSFNDPSRITANFAGVTATQDGSNDIIIRGNSPKYVQWRLEGMQISNPNHFGDQSGVGGGGSTLNNNMLTNSDFYTGAFSPEFGDALSGVYDVKLRTGNNEQFESVFGFGIIGTDITLEGPFKKGYDGSYIVNYRYSTVSILDKLGIIDIGGIPKFQDASFKVVLPTKKMGKFSVFGIGGISSFIFKDIKLNLWDTPGDRGMIADIKEDFEKKANLGNLGLNHTYSLSPNSYLKTSVLYSTEGINDHVYESKFIKISDMNGNFLRDSTVNKTENYRSRIRKNTYRGAITYSHKLNAKHKIQIGTKYAYFDYQNKQSMFLDSTGVRFALTDFDENISTIRNFVSWKYRINNDITLVYGLHNMNVLYNKKSTLEPRVALNWKLSNRNSFHGGYGNHSTMEAVHNYFAKVNIDGQLIEPNKDLDLLKAHHFVLGFERRFTSNLVAKLEVYYQHLYNLPIENLDTSYYATINEGLEFRFVDLVNEGTGKNYGIELTLERFFSNNYYYLINASLFDSKYTSLNGVERNTQYNSKYLVNILAGKEFPNLGKKNNQILGLNAKVFFGGGKKILPLLRDSEGKLAVDPENGQFYDYSRAYEDKIEDLYSVVLSASYKWNKPSATHEIFFSLDNVTNNKGKITEYYDADEPNSIGYTSQFGFFPNILYRVYF